MRKKIALILTAGVIILLLIGCNAPQVDNEPIMQTTDIAEIHEILENEIVNNDEIEVTEIPIDKELVRNTEVTQISHIEPTDPVIPQNQLSITNPTGISEQNATQNLDNTANQTPLPTQELQQSNPNISSEPIPTTTPNPQPEATPVPTPKPQPEPKPEPTPEPAPQPIVHEPPPARTICNICGADITGAVAEHGTPYLLNGENFSYRVE